MPLKVAINQDGAVAVIDTANMRWMTDVDTTHATLPPAVGIQATTLGLGAQDDWRSAQIIGDNLNNWWFVRAAAGTRAGDAIS